VIHTPIPQYLGVFQRTNLFKSQALYNRLPASIAHRHSHNDPGNEQLRERVRKYDLTTRRHQTLPLRRRHKPPTGERHPRRRVDTIVANPTDQRAHRPNPGLVRTGRRPFPQRFRDKFLRVAHLARRINPRQPLT
jgi:hypothetical protein